MPPAPIHDLPLRCVILLHILPNGSSHFDWLTARAREPGAPLLSFRASLRPDDPGIEVFTAEPLPDHRALYLDFEGELEPKEGHPRGAVRLLAVGTAAIHHADAERVDLSADWGRGPHRYRGARGEERWVFTASQPD